VTPPNDWEIRKCLSLSLAILLAVLGLVGLDYLGFDIPGLRQIAGFVFLTFVPGVLILRILKIHNIGIIESLLYSVGLSLAFVIFLGLAANFALPPIGISKPISVLPVLGVLTIFTVILMPIAYLRDKSFSASTQFTLTKFLSPSSLFLILVLFLTIFGALMVNYYQNNILLLIFIIVVAGVVGLAAFGRFIDHKVYPLAIAIIAIGLLYQTTLISPHLVGADIHIEYYFEQLVVDNGYWDAAIPHTYNSGLSITMLAPIYSLILNTDGAWLFKIIYPFIFSLVPLALFHIFSQQMTTKKAFLAAFFFMAVPIFSLEMIALAKQQIAEFFFVLFILLMVDRKLGLTQRLTLAIVFALSIAVSHYGLGSVCLIYFALGLLLLVVIRSSFGRRVWGWLTGKFGGLPASLVSPRAFPLRALCIVVAIYFAGSLAYYAWAASGVSLRAITSIWQGQATAITTELTQLLPRESEMPSESSKSSESSEPSVFLDLTKQEPLIQTAFGLDFPSASTQGKGFRIFQYITQLFLIIGFIRLISKPRNLGFTGEYIAFTWVSGLLLLACILLPGFSYTLNATRFYHITLFLLAPLCILGGEAIWLGIGSVYRKLKRGVKASGFSLVKAEDNQAYLGFLTLAILVPYFLFTSGFVFEVTKDETIDVIDEPYSIALSSYRVDIGGVSNLQDGAGADWLAQRLKDDYAVYADWHAGLLLFDQTELQNQVFCFRDDTFTVPEDSYIYLRTWNMKKQEITFWAGAGLRKSISSSEAGVNDLVKSRNRIYSNNGAQVLAPR
jgi:uncharacterized membrane protein